MELQFTKSEGTTSYVSEIEVNQPFNLHVEKDFPGQITVSVKTDGDQYSVCDGFPKYGNTLDKDFKDFIIFPKYIKVEVSALLELKGTETVSGTVNEA